ncbi:MAG: ATP-dependent Clp protease proteolytic subunit, partial [Spirochaetales bacterium]|nr:ATP-dependent Clp protease proteolytic subunit [Spirochaetales bacterium]
VSADTERDCWLSSKEAKEYGIVGKIISSKSEI